MDTATTEHWTPVDGADGYECALIDGNVAVRNKGKRLKSVPAKLKQTETVADLIQLRDWLAGHERQCRAEVEHWIARSTPVPAEVLAAVWTDPAWAGALRDLVVRSEVGGSSRDVESSEGLLRGFDAERGAGLVTLDGESIWSTAAAWSIPHPVLIADLAEYRTFALDLDVTQGTEQLFRETWTRDPSVHADTSTRVNDYSGGRFAQLRHLSSRAITRGYAVRGGYASTVIWEAGGRLEARSWIGADAPDVEAETGELMWVDDAEKPRPLSEVGPVAWSEGMRMAAALYAGRTVEEDQQ